MTRQSVEAIVGTAAVAILSDLERDAVRRPDGLAHVHFGDRRRARRVFRGTTSVMEQCETSTFEVRIRLPRCEGVRQAVLFLGAGDRNADALAVPPGRLTSGYE